MRVADKKRFVASVIALLLSLYGVVQPTFAHASNPSCSPTATTVGSQTVLEFDYAGSDTNTNGNNKASTCDWTVPSFVTSISVVVVGGGGSGGYGNQGGGGGGGEVLYSSSPITVSPNSIKTISVGAGGGGINSQVSIAQGNDGATSSFAGVVAHGGGGGGGYPTTTSSNGGSGIVIVRYTRAQVGG